jgi:hypothetical protein
LRFLKFFLLGGVALFAAPSWVNAAPGTYGTPTYADVNLVGAGSLQAALTSMQANIMTIQGTANGAQQRSSPYVITNGSINTYSIGQVAPLSTAATAGLNPLPIGSPLYNWGQGTPTTVTAAGGVTDPLGLYINNGAVIINKPRSWGTEDRSVGLGVMLNAAPNADGLADNNHPSVLGSIAQQPSRLALANGSDAVAGFFANTSIPPISVDPTGSFDATDYYPSAGHVLTTTQVAQLRVGMYLYADISANFGSGWTAIITGWNANGTSVQVSGWYAIGNQSSGQVPTQSTPVLVGAISAIWAENSNVTLNAGDYTDQAIGYEMDVANNTGIDPGVGGQNLTSEAFDAQSTGGTEAQFAFNAGGNGGWAGDFVGYTASFCVVCAFAQNPTGAAFYSNQFTGLVLEENNNGTAKVSIDSSGDEFLAGNANILGTLTGVTQATASGAFISLGTGGEAFESGPSAGNILVAIDQAGDANFRGNVDISSTTVTGLITAGAMTAPVATIATTLEIPRFVAPSGTCTAPGSFAVDPSGNRLYVCPSIGSAWKYITITGDN